MKLSLIAGSIGLAVVLGSSNARAQTTGPGCTAAGVLPPALPARLLIGIDSSSPGDTWAKQSGTKWDIQWLYLSGQSGDDWYNDYGYGAADGSSIDDLFTTIDGNGFIPGIHLYNMGYGHDGGDSGILTEIQNPTWSKAYFTEFKALMTHAKTFGKPVVIVLEGDSFGFLENLTSNDPTVAAAVASTGMPELASLPNTVAGFGMAYLAIRKSVGAANVAMGPDTPYYAAQGDIMNFAPSDMQDLQPHVDFQWKFFGAFVGANATGARFDFSASCPDASDCAAYTDGRPCWDPSDGASVDTPSINRYIQWLHLYNQTSGVAWMLHQVPLGNSQHRNVPYDGSARSGYQDNRAEYLFQYESPASTAIRDQHLTNFANAGVVGMLFGSSDDGDTPSTDLWLDNLPFLKTHVAVVNNSGGFSIGRSDGTTCSATGTSGAGGAAGSTGGGGSGGTAGTTGSSGTAGTRGAAGTTGAAGTGGTTGSSGSVPEAGASAGCGCDLTGHSPAGKSGITLLALSLVLLRLRRRERQH